MIQLITSKERHKAKEIKDFKVETHQTISYVKQINFEIFQFSQNIQNFTPTENKVEICNISTSITPTRSLEVIY